MFLEFMDTLLIYMGWLLLLSKLLFIPYVFNPEIIIYDIVRGHSIVSSNYEAFFWPK